MLRGGGGFLGFYQVYYTVRGITLLPFIIDEASVATLDCEARFIIAPSHSEASFGSGD